MGDESHGLMQLRPVMFRYRSDYTEGERVPQPGLIAEEVAEVYPHLVTYSADGDIQSVQYHKLTTMLLNELQKQEQRAQEQEQTIANLTSRLDALEGQRK